MIRQSQNNGRVNIRGQPDISQLFAMYEKVPANQCATFRNPTEGLWNNTDLSTLFFSKENMQIIQNGIRAGVHHKSNGQYLIPEQNCDYLKIIMRSIFLQYAANKPTHIREQVEQLNKMVIDFAIEQLYGEAQSYLKYLKDVSTLVVPISRPIMTSNNDRELEFKGWF